MSVVSVEKGRIYGPGEKPQKSTNAVWIRNQYGVVMQVQEYLGDKLVAKVKGCEYASKEEIEIEEAKREALASEPEFDAANRKEERALARKRMTERRKKKAEAVEKVKSKKAKATKE